VEGKVVISPIRQGEPVLRSRLAPETLAQGGVPAIIAPQKRALAVKVDKVIGVSGFIKPGNKVDVLVTVNHPETQVRFTKTVLENMLVLAIGTQMEQPDKNQPPVEVDVITMEVTPEEAEKLALASTEGRIMMALRGYTDDVEVFTKGETVETLLAAYTKAEEKKRTVRRSTAPARKPAPRKQVSRPAGRAYTVWVINGSDVATAKVSGGE
jgi:pilus assembly protein CpaB